MKNLLFFTAVTITLLFANQATADNYIINRLLIDAPVGFDTQDFRTLLRIREGGVYSSADLNKELKRLFKDGKYRALSFDPLIRTSGNIDLRVLVDPRLSLGEITLRGNKAFSTKELNQISKLRSGDSFSRESINRSIEKLNNAYNEAGYFQIEITHSETSSQKPLHVDTTINISEGKPAKIRRITISGVPQEAKRKFLKDLNFKEGDHFTKTLLQSGIDNARNRLYEDLFLEAEIAEPDVRYENNQSEIKIFLRVNLGPKYNFSFSGNSHFSDRKLNKLTIPPDEALFGPVSLGDISSRINREYRLNGFHFVEVSYDVKEELYGKRKLYLGPRFTLRKIFISLWLFS